MPTITKEREIRIKVCFWQDEQVRRLLGVGGKAKDLHICQAGKSVNLLVVSIARGIVKMRVRICRVSSLSRPSVAVTEDWH